jgi:hypothetical protein
VFFTAGILEYSARGSTLFSEGLGGTIAHQVVTTLAQDSPL